MDTRIKNIIGNKYGKLLVLSYDEKMSKEKGRPFWICQCDCGNIKSIRGQHLKVGNTTSCGNCPKPDYTNMRFGRWIVLEKSRKSNKKSWICKCDCGNIRNVHEDTLLNGHSKSCGCLQKEVTTNRLITHNLSNNRLYTIYYGMKQRCYNKKDKRYKDYGGRGIFIYDGWLGKNGFVNFYNWAMKNGYKENLTIDRIDNNGNYEPLNCKWATKAQQDCNKRTNIFFTFCGVKMCLKQLTNLMGWSYKKYYTRYNRKTTVFRGNEVDLIENKIKEIKKNE